MTPESSNKLSLGFSLMLGAFLCFALLDTSAKWLVVSGLPALQVVFMRYLGHFVATVVVYWPREGRRMFQSKTPRVQTLRAVLLLCSTTLNFFALVYLPLTTTIAIFFAAPLVVCLLSIPVLGERVGLPRFSAVLTGFAGVLIIVEPWGAAFSPKMLLAMGAMCCASCYFVLTRKIAGIDNNSVSQAFSSGIATVVLLPVGIYLWQTPVSTFDWLPLIAVGILGMVGHTLLTIAHRFVEASVLAPTVYSQILYATLFSWLFFNQIPDNKTVLGTLIIVASGLFVWHRERTRPAVTKGARTKTTSATTRAGR